MSELRECPFCGGKIIKIDAIPSTAQFYRCERCKAKGPYWTADEDAKTKWNTRAADAEIKELVEALEIAMAGGDYLPAERKELERVIAKHGQGGE